MSNIYMKWCSCSRWFLAIVHVCTFSYELTRFLIVKGSCFLCPSSSIDYSQRCVVTVFDLDVVCWWRHRVSLLLVCRAEQGRFLFRGRWYLCIKWRSTCPICWQLAIFDYRKHAPIHNVSFIGYFFIFYM